VRQFKTAIPGSSRAVAWAPSRESNDGPGWHATGAKNTQTALRNLASGTTLLERLYITRCWRPISQKLRSAGPSVTGSPDP
jgi:hypothetical protein